ncbi:MAG: hypothetical protein ACRC68_08320, partial [Clostridium sp.]
MKLVLSLLSSLFFLVNTNSINLNLENKTPKIIDAFKLAYDSIYTADIFFDREYIILDMESIYFVDTTYEEREDT